MKKEKIILDDGRYLIYYKFGKEKDKNQDSDEASKIKCSGGNR